MSRRARIVLLQLAITMVLASNAGAEQWRTYNATRFGAIVDVPTSWSMLPPPANNDGRGFRSPDGKAEMNIGGSFVTDDLTSDLRASTQAHPDNGEIVTYKRLGDTWAVASGYKSDGKIFYRKSIAACGNGIINSVSIEYPRSRKQEFDPIVQHVSRSLRNANVSGECQ
jgi:hypothetical protein